MIHIQNSNIANLNLGSQIGTIDAALQSISRGDESQREFAQALEELTQAVVAQETLPDTDKQEVVRHYQPLRNRLRKNRKSVQREHCGLLWHGFRPRYPPRQVS